MSAEQLDRLRTLLSAAVHLPWPQRADYLRHRCPDDALVRDEALSLVELYDSADGFLTKPFPEMLGARAAEPVHLPPGTLLHGRFRIEEKIAQSSFATVYLAVNIPVGEKRVVIKVLDQFQNQAALAETFAAELKSLSRLHHPNVVGISDVGTLDSGVPFLVLNYVPGVTLRELLRHGRLPIPRALSLVKEIGKALAVAHQAGIWHLDLKPENIIVSDPDSADERITLIDFGIARLKTLPTGSLLAGSPRYMAPEQQSTPSAQCDIYSLSLVAFELFAGHLPHRHTRIEDQLPPRLGNAAARAIAQGLQPDPSRRFAQVPEFLAALQKAPAPPYRRFVNLAQTAVLTLLVAPPSPPLSFPAS